MNIVNGKLINKEVNHLETLTQKTEDVIQRCNYLESQFTIMNNKSNTQSLYKLEQRICFLEETTSTQAKQLLFFKISSVIALLGWLMLSMNYQPESHQNQPQQHTKSTDLHSTSIHQHSKQPFNFGF